MKCTITGKGMKLTEGMKDAVVTSLSRLDKFFDEEPVAKVVCKKDANIHKIEVMITYHKKNIRVESGSADMYASMDLATELMERKIRKYKTQITKGMKSDSIRIPKEEEIPVDEVYIDKTKTYSTTPLDSESACHEMELLEHDFHLFVNAETGNVCAVYKKKNGQYGMIVPA